MVVFECKKEALVGANYSCDGNNRRAVDASAGISGSAIHIHHILGGVLFVYFGDIGILPRQCRMLDL